MSELPKITRELVNALNYFEPIAGLIHSKASKGFVHNMTIQLANEWLEIEMSEAIGIYRAQKGLPKLT